jgi:hypothetical protein
VQRGERPLLLVALDKVEVGKVASVGLAVPLGKECLIIHKGQTGDQETETLLVDNQMLHYKVLDEVVLLSVVVKLQLHGLAQLSHSNNQDRPLQKMLEPDLPLPMLVLLALASHLASSKAAVVATPLDLPFHMHLSVGKPSQRIGKV